jgi:hypothetical protein
MKAFVGEVVLVAVVEDVDVRGRPLSLLGLCELDHVLLHALDVAAAMRVAVDLLGESGQGDAEGIRVLGENGVDVRIWFRFELRWQGMPLNRPTPPRTPTWPS